MMRNIVLQRQEIYLDENLKAAAAAPESKLLLRYLIPGSLSRTGRRRGSFCRMSGQRRLDRGLGPMENEAAGAVEVEATR